MPKHSFSPKYVARFMQKVEVDATTGCWNWTAATVTAGYGKVTNGLGRPARSLYAHRVSYEIHREPIPMGLVIDHLCENKRCVNPDHLEAVPSSVNTLRGTSVAAINSLKTHCKHGHEFTPENTYVHYSSRRGWRRGCRQCKRDSDRRIYARRRAA